jgi:hypothetical protein
MAIELKPMNQPEGQGGAGEGEAFIKNGPGKREPQPESGGLASCCKSKHTSR